MRIHTEIPVRIVLLLLDRDPRSASDVYYIIIHNTHRNGDDAIAAAAAFIASTVDSVSPKTPNVAAGLEKAVFQQYCTIFYNIETTCLLYYIVITIITCMVGYDGWRQKPCRRSYHNNNNIIRLSLSLYIYFCLPHSISFSDTDIATTS